MRGRVIITHGRSLQALVAARSLALQGVEVIGCDHVPLMALSFSKYVKSTFLLPDPLEDSDAWLDTLQENIVKHRPDNERTPYVLMPLHRNLPLVAAARERFETSIRIAAPDLASIRAVMPKNYLVETCRKHDVLAPRTWLVSSLGDIDAACEDDSFPKYVKLADSAGGAGVARVASRNDLRSTCEEMIGKFDVSNDKPLLVQRAAPGDDYCFTGLFDQGKRVASMTYRNDRTFPVEDGVGVLRTTVDDAPFLPGAEKLMQALQWHGVAEIDFRWTGQADDDAQLIEVNPRFWGGLFQSVMSGVDYPWMLYRQTTAGKIDEESNVVVGQRTRVPMLDWGAAILEWRYDDPDAWKKLVEYWNQQGDIPAELTSTDDRGAALGALHVVGSLIRYGRLPQEMQSDQRESPAIPTSKDRPRVLLSFDRDWLHWFGIGNFFFRRLLRRSGARMRALHFEELEADLKPVDARNMIESVDALLLGGGGDVDPGLYGSDAEARNVKPRRDRFELALIEAAVRQAKPILGVCRGCQLLNVALGGSLKGLAGQAQVFNHRRVCPHPVVVKTGSRVGRLVGRNRINRVRSVHRQAVDRPGDSVRVVARASDGVVEAIESYRGWYVGVQWHPEWILFDSEGKRIIDGFVEAAVNRRRLGGVPATSGRKHDT